jgi:hypothetical protein
MSGNFLPIRLNYAKFERAGTAMIGPTGCLRSGKLQLVFPRPIAPRFVHDGNCGKFSEK